MNVTKNQHIVPQVYLKSFTIPNINKLECLNVDELRIEKPQSPKSICSGHFFYAMEPGKEDEYSQIVENNFRHLENWYGKNIERIKEEIVTNHSISNDDKYGLSWLIANFYFRGYYHRYATKQSLDKLMKWLKPSVSRHIHEQCIQKYPKLFSNDKESKKTADRVVEETLQEYANNTSYATNLTFHVGFPNTLTHKKWSILINNNADYPFITGDEAIIVINNEKIPNIGVSNSFLCLTHIFHLSPSIAITASFPFSEEERGKFIYEDITNNQAKIFEQNLFYINHTHEYCYSSKKEFFHWLIEFEKNKKVI